MKKLSKILAIAAIAVPALVSCNKQEVKAPASKNKVQVSFTASMPQTRTEMSGNNIVWSESDVAANQIRLIEFIDSDYSQGVINIDGNISPSGEATFIADLEDNSEWNGFKFDYSAFYPASIVSFCGSDGLLSFHLNSEQTFTEGSFDPSADILVSTLYDNELEQINVTSNINFTFKRYNALAKMTIKGFTPVSGEKVQSVSFQAIDKVLSSDAVAKLRLNGNVDWLDGNTSDKITVNFPTPASSLSDVWFSCVPATLETGDTYEIVITTDQNTYTKTGHIGANPLSFTAGDVTTFTVNFSEIEGVSKDPHCGTFVILAYDGSNFYAVSNVVSDKSRLKEKLFKYDNASSITTDDTSLLWTISKNGEHYKISSNDGKYMTWTSGNTTALGNDAFNVDIIAGEIAGYLRITHDSDSDSDKRYLARNTGVSGDDKFAFYKISTVNKDLLLVPAVYEAQPTLEVDVTELTWAADETDTKTINVTAADAEGNPAEWDYTPKEDANFTIEKTATGLTVTPKAVNEDEVNDNICNIEITFGTLSETIVATQSKKPAGGVTKLFRKVTSDQADWSGTYLIVYETGSVAFNGSLTTLDATFNTISVSISDEVIAYTEALLANTFVIASKSGGYSVKSASANYIGRTTNNNGFDSSETDKYTNTISFVSKNDIKIVGSGGPYLRYNSDSGQKRFRFYKSGQQAIQLYKLVEE